MFEAEVSGDESEVDIEEVGAIALRSRVRGRTVLEEDLNIVGDIIDAAVAEDEEDRMIGEGSNGCVLRGGRANGNGNAVKEEHNE